MKRKPSQRDYIRELVKRFVINESRWCVITLKRNGGEDVERKSNANSITSEPYARALWSKA
jgi:hypothetical protein